MNKKANWTLSAIFGLAGIGMLLDAIWLKVLLPANRFFEGLLGLVFIVLAIATNKTK
jgi:hypothetical protein